MSIQARIEAKLAEALPLDHLDVVNESYMHAVPPGAESHFKVVAVSASFEGKRPVARHQLVYAALQAEQSLIHALALHLYTPAEWRERHGEAPMSPPCMGGSKKHSG